MKKSHILIILLILISLVFTACSNTAPQTTISSENQASNQQEPLPIPFDLLSVGMSIPKVSFQVDEEISGTVQIINNSTLKGSTHILVCIDNATIDEYKGILQPDEKQSFPIVLKSDELGTHRLSLHLSDGHTFYDTLLFHVYSSLKSKDEYEAIAKKNQPEGITVNSVVIDGVALFINGDFDPNMWGTLNLIESFASAITSSRQLTIPELSGVSMRVYYPEIDHENFTFTLRIDLAPTGGLKKSWSE